MLGRNIDYKTQQIILLLCSALGMPQLEYTNWLWEKDFMKGMCQLENAQQKTMMMISKDDLG